jgi:non-ribosomal peptide synthetase component E (peptide arylation enzyme)
MHHPIRTLPLVVVCGLILGVAPVLAMPVHSMVALKKAGLSDATIEMAASEKVIETAAFSVDELIQLKQAGFEERTIQVLIRERSFMRRPSKIVYGRQVKPLKLSSVDDVIALKQSGMSDDIIQAIVRVAGERRDEDYDRAWQMLENMDLEVQVRP